MIFVLSVIRVVVCVPLWVKYVFSRVYVVCFNSECGVLCYL